jgi:hypothetical protein
VAYILKAKRETDMKANKFFYIAGIILFIFTIVPGTGFCDLKLLKDTDLSKIDAQSGFSKKENKIRADRKPGEHFDCVIDEDGFCGVNGASTCSTVADCFNNEQFTANYPNPPKTYYINQAPSCRSGGCGK